ncbi:probable serine/threonine-protein kinase PBL7 [Selaginella moellendorffii]|nr:probable serine/threonine-protein kinase PBL7 [Selaginella moellendorffii]|eukprot:XP_002988428.2 probable serine/threonine-protein kinase PBL7 [Selaginella moellendorffii]
MRRILVELAGDNTSEDNLVLIIAIIIASAALVLVAIAFAYYCYLRHKARAPRQEVAEQAKSVTSQSISLSRRSSYNGSTSEAQVFTYKQMQAATNNFTTSNEVGQGGFGSVFRGVLPDGRTAAIKQLDRGGKQGDREFRVEVDMLSRLHSPHLLELIGYCADQEHRLLVYEFMPNGSVQEHLHSDGTSGRPPMLDWDTRMRVALDAARGLEYLHEMVSPPIIHRDFKSSNILLDDKFNAKVSDFGLAKLGSDKAGGHVSTRVLGTQGYVAPEYALTGHLTTKSDVYSFGVVLLELLTGRVPVDMKRPPGEGVLVSWALPRLTDRNKMVEIIDPRLNGQFAMKDLIQIAAIAAMCVQPEADYRPFITDVVQSLVPLVKHNRPMRVSSSPSFLHATVTVKSSSAESGSSDCRSSHVSF